jgi:small Trp-rich protein
MLRDVIFWEIFMFLAAIAVIILIMKLTEIGPVATWSWFYVLLPFALLAFWWEYLSKWIGWDKRSAEKKMAADVKENEATKKKNRGF